MRILRVVTLGSRSGRYGGPFDTAANQAHLLAESGVHVTLLYGYLKEDAPVRTDAATTSRAVRVRRLLPSPGFTSYFSKSMWQALREEIAKADVVHISVAREVIPIAALHIARRRSKPIVAQPHGMLTTSERRYYHRIIDVVMRRLLRSNQTRFLALTEDEAERLAEVFGLVAADVDLLGNPVPPHAYELRNSRVPGTSRSDVLFLGRLDERKRVDVFVAAARYASERGWPDRYRVIGPDAGERSVVEHAETLLPNLTYEGAVSGAEVPELVARAGVYVLPSRNEPWGNVLAQALVMNVPVVVSQSAALAAAVSRIGAGLVVEDGDASALAEAAHSLLASPSSTSAQEVASVIPGARESAVSLLACYKRAAIAAELE